jgi:hypothetical protein
MRRWVVVPLFAMGCGTSVPGTARIAQGASASAAARVDRVAAPAIDGRWTLSPNSATVTITKLRFWGDDQETVDIEGCTPTYERDAPRLSTFLDCPFEVPTGTYRSLSIAVAGDASVMIDDPVNGLFTDPTAPSKLVSSPPAGGARPVDITVATAGEGGNESRIQFVDPLEVTEGNPVTVTILVDMIHTMSADTAGGAGTFDLSLPLSPAFLVASAAPITSGSVEFYSVTGTADNFTAGIGGTGTEAGSARVFYLDGKPTFTWHVIASNSESYAADPRGGSGERAGGYLGLDSTGTLCWAHTNSPSWDDDQYTELCRLHRGTNVGEQSSIECAHQTTVPPPTSGNTYESGCPAFTPDTTTAVTLVAR